MNLNKFFLFLCCSASYQLKAITAGDLHSAFWADYNQFNKNGQIAYQWYKKLLAHRDRPAYMFKGLLNFLFQTNNLEQLLFLIPELDPAFTDDIDVQLLFAQALERSGQQAASDQKYLRLLEKAKDNQAIAFQAAQIYLRRKEPENALATIKDFLALAPGNPNNFIFYFLEAQTYLFMERGDAALAAIQKALDLHPAFDKGWLLSAMLYEQTGQLKKAIESYSTFLSLQGKPSGHIQAHLMQLVMQQKLQEQTSPLSSERSPYDQALQLYASGRSKEALMMAEMAIAQQPKHLDAQVLKIQLLFALNQTDAAYTQLINWYAQDQKELWLELMHLLALQETAKGITVFEQLKKIYSSHTNIGLYLADLYMRTEQSEAAVQELNRALPHITDQQLQAKILTQLGSLYYSTQNLEPIPALIDQAEKLTIHDAHLTNLLAYWYAGRGNNKEKAEHLIAQALATEPRNPFFLDTKAYIHYKNHEYQTAIALLEEAIAHMQNEPLILKHLIKCYIKSGKADLASEMLKQAQLTLHERESLMTLMHKMDITIP